MIRRLLRNEKGFTMVEMMAPVPIIRMNTGIVCANTPV